MPGDQQVVSASRDRTIRIFDVASTSVSTIHSSLTDADTLLRRHLIRTIAGHTEWVRGVVPSDDGKLIASCSKDHVCSSSYISEYMLTIPTDRTGI